MRGDPHGAPLDPPDPRMPHRVAVFIGTRPEAIKMAPVVRALERAADLEPVVVSTGQHREMLQQVIDVFGLPVHHDLDVMVPDQRLAGLSARLIEAVDGFLRAERPDFALVQGDTSTVLMAALACFYGHVPFGHVEAGLRTGDLQSPFPEEANRRLVTPLAALHFAPTEWAATNLRDEGVRESAIAVTGNTVVDALRLEIARQDEPEVRLQVDEHVGAVLGEGWRERPYVLITGHRRENFGRGVEQICAALHGLATRFPGHAFVYPVHLNPRVRGPVEERLSGLANVYLTPPAPYRPFVALMRHARVLLTDSGGVQEEAPGLGVPVLVMRDTTERPEGVAAGTLRLVGADAARITEGVARLLEDEAAHRAMSEAENPYGDGHAAGRIVDAVRTFLNPSAPVAAATAT